MGVTLNEYLKTVETDLRAGVIKNLLRYSDLIGLVRFETISGLRAKALRWMTLPDVTWRDLNDDYGTGTGTVEEIEEALYDLGHYVDIEKLFIEAKDHVVDPMVLQINMVTQSLSFEFNDKFINGSPIVDPKGVWGLAYRISKLPASQTMYLDANGDGTGATLKVLAAGDANKKIFIDKLDELIDLVGGVSAHEPDRVTAILMNKKTFQNVRSILRDLNWLNQSKDQFGRTIYDYAGARLIDVGLKADKATGIILNTETFGNSESSGSSMYAVNLTGGDSEGFFGVQLHPLKTDDVGILESRTKYRTVINWPIGFMGLSDYYAARACGFEMAAT